MNKYNNKTYNNFFCPHDVIEDLKFKAQPISARYLYIILCHLANTKADKHGWFYRSIPQLMQDSNLGRTSIIKSKKILEKNQFIDIKRAYLKHSKQRTYDYFRLNGFRFKV